MPYEPRRDTSGYPGAHLPPERAEQLRNLDVDVDDITVDDIVHSLSRGGSSYWFGLLRMVSRQFGDDAARDMARRFGYLTGRSNYRKMQRRFGVESLGPERCARYEDVVHVLSGVDMAFCLTEYDEDTCVVRRTRCSFHTGAPEGAGHYCRDLNEGFCQAYQELDPDLVEASYDTSMVDGAPECVHVFRWRRSVDSNPANNG